MLIMRRSRELFRTVISFAFCLAMIFCSASAAFACTAIYVGSGVSDDGTVMIAKSNDYQALRCMVCLYRYRMHDVTDELKEIEPLSVELDGSEYQKIPEIS